MRFFRYWVPLILFAGGIFYLSSIPGDGFPTMSLTQGWIPKWIAKNPDKVVHILLYAFLGWLCLRALACGSLILFPRVAWLTLMIVSFYGASDEFHQYFVPKRSCDIYDWMADTAGGLIAIAICSRFYMRRQQMLMAQKLSAQSV